MAGALATSSAFSGLNFSAADTAGDAAASDVAQVYETLVESTSEFQAALELHRMGRERAGKRRMDAVLAQLTRQGQVCVSLPGCDVARVFRAFQTLVRLQTLALDVAADDPLAGMVNRSREAPSGQHARDLRKPSSFHGKALKDVIVLNGPVRASITDWLTWMRPQLIEAWTNYQFLRHLMWPKYEQAGLPEALLFGILAKESVGRVHSYSRAGAAGPLQFMPATGRRYGLAADPKFDLRLDPKASTRANVEYLLDELSRHDNELEMALAAYNGGEGRVSRLAAKFPGQDFWSDQIYLALPSETRDYVPKVLAAAYLFEHPEEFNLKFPELPNKPALLKLDRPLSLSELAICAGQNGRQDGWFRTLRNLNPRLKPELRLRAGTELRVPAKLIEGYVSHCHNAELMARVAVAHDARFPVSPALVPYLVQKGDTLSLIAERSRCADIGDLATINAIAAPRYALKPGQMIKLPTCT